MKNLSLHFLFSFFFVTLAFSQSTISTEEYRGSEASIARGILEGNAIQTNYRNYGEYSRWNDIPWGVWPHSNCDRFDPNCTGGGGGTHIDGVGFIIAAKVIGERAKWSNYYGEGVQDTTLNPVIINYRQAGARTSPYTGDIWGWLPLNGFNNPLRIDPGTFGSSPIPATSDDGTSWPESWPDRLNETTDAGWSGSWNGFRGKGLVNGDQETFYVMDDFSDQEYSFGQEIEGPHSDFGVYHPSSTDSSMGGLGLQTEVRTFQFNDPIGKDILFAQYRVTNVSEKNLDSVWVGTIVDGGLGVENDDDNALLRIEENVFVLWDDDGIGEPFQAGDDAYALGYVGFLILEHSKPEANQVDDDNDGIIDESKFNGPGEFLEGKAAIDSYLEANYNMDRFNDVHIDLEDFPAYRNQRWWTGDEDLDWIAYDDLNENGTQDEDEPLQDDVGRDGLGPDDENYPGPDEGEGDGIPTQGEPNFGELDMLEAENTGRLSFYDNKPRTFYESGNNLRDDTWMFNRIRVSEIDGSNDIEGVTNADPFVLSGVGAFPLESNASSYFITALIFGEDEEDLNINIERAKAIYESDYGQSMFLTNSEDDHSNSIPTEISLSQNYPNPFNPTTNIEFGLSRGAPITLEVFDITGRLVQSLISNQNYPAGIHTVQFEAGTLSSGVYIYRLEVSGQVFTKKLTLIK